MTLVEMILFTLLFIAALYGIYYLWLWVIRKHSATMVDSVEMNENIRRVQVIDVREPAEFDANHVLGARNIPISQFKARFNEIRRDQKIYLYDDSLNYTSRAANILRKNGYQEIHILKGGFSNWTGKIKSNIK